MSGSVNLATTTCGAVHLDAPTSAPSLRLGEFGHLWEWVGDGEVLVALVVTVRSNTRLTSAMSVRNRLTWELDQIADQMESTGARTEPAGDLAETDSAGHPVSVGQIDGTRRGLAVREHVVVTTDGTDLYSVDLVVVAGAAGDEVASRIISSVGI